MEVTGIRVLNKYKNYNNITNGFEFKSFHGFHIPFMVILDKNIICAAGPILNEKQGQQPKNNFCFTHRWPSDVFPMKQESSTDISRFNNTHESLLYLSWLLSQLTNMSLRAGAEDPNAQGCAFKHPIFGP